MFLPIAAMVAQMYRSSDLRRSVAAGDTTAVFMMPPDTVCGAEALSYQWTADGNSLITRRYVTEASTADLAAVITQTNQATSAAQRVRGRLELNAWDLKTRKSRSVFSIPQENGTIGEGSTLPGTDRFIFIVTERQRDGNGNVIGNSESINMLAAGLGTIVRVSYKPETEPAFQQLMVSPKRPLAIVRRVSYDSKIATLRFFGVDGRLGQAISVDPKDDVEFDANGMPGIFVFGPPAKGARRTFYFRKIDPLSGRIGEPVLVTPPGESKEGEPPMISATSVASVAPANVAIAPAIFLNVKGGKSNESGIVSTDGIRPVLSPRLDAVAYMSQGSVMVRPLVPMPRDAYDKARLAAERTLALSNAKQVGLALIMFASDSEDIFPGQDVDLRSRLEPYTKNSKLFDNFSYTFGGGSMTAIEKPAETSLGYVTGPGGRAVIYADGHVKWVPDAP